MNCPECGTSQQTDIFVWPIFAIGSGILTIVYLASFTLEWPFTVGISLTIALLALGFAWWLPNLVSWQGASLRPLTYLAYILIYGAHFVVLDGISSGQSPAFWPVITVVLSGLFLGTSWVIRGPKRTVIYSIPARWSGRAFMIIPLVAALVNGEPLYIGLTYGLAAAILIADALYRQESITMGAGLALLTFGFYTTAGTAAMPSQFISLTGALLAVLFFLSGQAASRSERTAPMAPTFRVVALTAGAIPLIQLLIQIGQFEWRAITTATLAIISGLVFADAFVHRAYLHFYIGLALSV